MDTCEYCGVAKAILRAGAVAGGKMACKACANKIVLDVIADAMLRRLEDQDIAESKGLKLGDLVECDYRGVRYSGVIVEHRQRLCVQLDSPINAEEHCRHPVTDEDLMRFAGRQYASLNSPWRQEAVGAAAKNPDESA